MTAIFQHDRKKTVLRFGCVEVINDEQCIFLQGTQELLCDETSLSVKAWAIVHKIHIGNILHQIAAVS